MNIISHCRYWNNARRLELKFLLVVSTCVLTNIINIVFEKNWEHECCFTWTMLFQARICKYFCYRMWAQFGPLPSLISNINLRLDPWMGIIGIREELLFKVKIVRNFVRKVLSQVLDECIRSTTQSLLIPLIPTWITVSTFDLANVDSTMKSYIHNVNISALGFAGSFVKNQSRNAHRATICSI